MDRVSKIEAASILLHEYVHTQQSGLDIGATLRAREREAYEHQIEYLILTRYYPSNPSMTPLTRQQLDGWIDEVHQNGTDYNHKYAK